MQDEIEEILKPVVEKDPRYPIDAYLFLHEALDYTLKRLGKQGHVTGQELCEGIRQLALQQFGLMARTVFASWGVTKTDHFGDMVYNLIDCGLWRKTEEDSKEDFNRVYDFDEAFEADIEPPNGEE